MTRESRRTFIVPLVLGLVMGGVLYTTSSKRSLDHDKNQLGLKPQTPTCAHRSISSVEEDDEQEKLKEICENKQSLETLKKDIEGLKKEKARILAAIDKVIEEKENDAKSDEDKRQEHFEALRLKLALQQAMAPRVPSPSFYSRGPQITEAYSPFHNMNQNQLGNYLQIAMSQRMGVMMEESRYWHPEWDRSGNMTNPLYGNGSTWTLLEGIYSDPMGPVGRPVGGSSYSTMGIPSLYQYNRPPNSVAW